MKIILICGASASGKTELALRVCDSLTQAGVSARVLALDNYYICHPELPFEERTLLNFDAPDSFDFDVLKADVEKLMQGKCINTKQYDFSQHLRHDTDEPIFPPEVLIIEGIHAFADKELTKLSDLLIYVDTDPDVCLARRMCRDTVERDRTVDAIALQYLDTVKPMYDRYIRVYKYDADICVVGGGKNERAVSLITKHFLS